VGPALTGRLEHEHNGVGAAIHLDGEDVVVVGAAENIGHVGEVQAHGEVAVAEVVIEGIGTEEERDERGAAGVHGLELKARAGEFEVDLTGQVEDAERLQDILEGGRLHQPQLQHGGGDGPTAAAVA